MGKVDRIILMMATVTAAAFVAGRVYSNAAFWRAYESCTQQVTAEYRRTIIIEFHQVEQQWKAKHDPLPSPLRAPVIRVYERPDYQAYCERIAPTRSDHPDTRNAERIVLARLPPAGRKLDDAREGNPSRSVDRRRIGCSGRGVARAHRWAGCGQVAAL